MELEKWAENIVKETYDKWFKYYPDWQRGFAVFYSPIRNRPPIMIITLNPGGSVKDFKKDPTYRQFKNGNFSLPKINRYKSNHRMSKAVRKFLGKQYIELLDMSVVIPILFFRSRSYGQWRSEFHKLYSKNDQKHIESFCYEKIAEILEKIRPKSVLVVGKGTFKMLVENGIFLPITIERIGYGKYGKSKQMNWCVAKWERVPIFCVRHLSRPLGSQNEKNTRLEFNKFLKINKIKK